MKNNVTRITVKIFKNDIYHVAELARLTLSGSDIDQYTTQIGDILNYVNMLNQIDTTNIEPTTHALAMTNAFREDIVQDSIPTQDVLLNAPHHDTMCFVVPKVVG